MSRVLLAGGGTGGHLYPALNLANALRDAVPETDVHFVGARRGIEARVLPEKGVSFTLLPIEPIRRDAVWRNWRLVPAVLGSVRGLARLFRRFAPRLVVGTGGYASAPACLWAVARRIPLALQEQNSYPGIATRWLSRWARQVHLGFPEAREHLRPGPRTEVFVLGNPIRPPDRTLDAAECRRAFGLPAAGVVVLVVGGSQGARAVNEALAQAIERVAAGSLPGRPDGLHLLWATGPAHYDALHGRLEPLGVADWIHLVGYIDEMPQALAASDLAVSRAGAMATAELVAWGLPAVLIPLPTAAANHQEHNAVALAEAGAAVHLPQDGLTADGLWAELIGLAADPAARRRMAESARRRSRPEAARRIAEQLATLLEAA